VVKFEVKVHSKRGKITTKIQDCAVNNNGQ